MGEKLATITNMLLGLIAFGLISYFIGQTFFPELTATIMDNTRETFTSGMGNILN